ncbi:MAG: hypothetical protein HY709_01605, partial [Candidatus Latescibacteria bacterium]|nr:hypothetical protein [Candidatus Latescibacterota bacterium]
MKVSDDGTVMYTRERLEISLRPMTDEELNRQFAAESQAGKKSTNPYTFGNWKDLVTKTTPNRFTVFLVKVKNYTYPKIKIDPGKMLLVASNGRQYSSLSFSDLLEYYHPYVEGYTGNAYEIFETRKDILQKTLYPGGVVFSGQEQQGYLLFPPLHEDVEQIIVELKDVALRFNVWGEPTEMVNLSYRFWREIGRLN